VKADPAAQLALLDLQELDSRVDQLRHQRATLPELAELEQLRRQRTELNDQVRDARVKVEDLTAEQQKVDSDVESVRARRERDRDRMDRGLVSNPKDLARMQHEMESLERRISDLEDTELEVMAHLDDAQRDLDSLAAQLDAVMERGRDRVAARDRRTAEIDAELAELEARRGSAAGGLPSDLLALYDKLRAGKGGVGAAELRARRCGGCQLTLDPAELGAIKSRSADDVVRCEECQRILVRTPESGL
jgi:hypothetical protein